MRYTSYGPSSERLGGLKRSRTARRDQWGRMLPNNGDLNPPTEHGKIGGQKRAKTAQRNRLGRFQ
jgi:hypothetical protein